MIKIFRKIRLRLLSDDKLSKYLIYAIGEIALVMIGILLALQVNNWNEKRKANIAEKELVTSFMEVIKSDEAVFRQHQTEIKRINSLHHNLYLIGVENKEIGDIGNPIYVRRLPQTGILSIDDFPNISIQISNETIRNSIIQYYSGLKIYNTVRQELREIVENRIRPCLGHENIYDLKEWYVNPTQTQSPNFVLKEKLIDLSKKPLFQQLLIQANIKLRSMNIFAEQLIETNKILNERLKTELGNY